MKKAGKILLIVVGLFVCIFGMNQFRCNHSAKENLREAGIRYYRMEDYSNAVESFSLALEQKEPFTKDVDLDIYYYLANGEFRQKHYSNAITYYNKLIELGEKSAGLYTDLGISYMNLSKYEAAYRALKKAVSYGDSTIDVYYNVCQACIYTNRSLECVKYAKLGYPKIKKTMDSKVLHALETKEISSLSKERRDLLKKYGTMAYMSGDEEYAYTIYSLLNDGQDEEIPLYLGYCLAGKKDYKGAIAAITQYEQTHEATPLADAKLAYCFIQLGQYEEAKTWIEKALSYENQPMKQELLMEKGIVFERTGDFDAAFDCFSEYVKAYPSDPKGIREYDFLVTRISDEKAAVCGVDNGNHQ